MLFIDPASSRPVRRALLVAFAVGLLMAACGPNAVAASGPRVPAGYTITKLADMPKGSGNCDDLGFLAGNLFVGCQDKTLSVGGGGNSTLVEVSPSGAIVKTWSIKDKIDGLAGDPLTHVVIVTLNEDANTHLATIDPATGQVTYYAYSPDPRGASTPTALHTGGGTDQVSVDSAGHVLITGSHAGTSTGTAVFIAKLTPPSSSGGTGTATLSPTFADNATAANGNTGSGTEKLKLGDVDSGAIVPQDVPNYGGGYVITDQTALELVFAKDIFHGSGLTVVKTPFGLDDLLWTSSAGGTLYVVDKGNPNISLPKVPVSSLYKVTGPFAKGTVLAANDGVGDQVVTVNVSNGKLTPFIRGLQTTKGLVYLNSDGTQTQLALNGAPTTPAPATTTSAAASTSVPKKSGSSSSTALIIVIIAAVVVVLGGGGFLAMRRRTSV